MDGVTILGGIGAALVLLAFALNQWHKWSKDYLIYDLVNFFGSLLLIIYALIIDSYPFFLLNIVWMLVSFRDLVVDLQRNVDKKDRGFYNKWLR